MCVCVCANGIIALYFTGELPVPRLHCPSFIIFVDDGNCVHSSSGDIIIHYSTRRHIKLMKTPQWGTADAEIQIPSVVEYSELKGSPFKAWSRSAFPPCMLCLLPGISALLISTLLVHPPVFFSQTSPKFFLCWLWVTPVPVWVRRIK